MSTETLTLTDFLLARIAEDEAAAQAASGATVTGCPGAWTPVNTGDEWEVAPPNGMEVEVLCALRPGLRRPPKVMGGYWGRVAGWDGDDDGADGYAMPVAEHIARHDPARVLAECEAHRAVVGMYRDAVFFERYLDGGFRSPAGKILEPVIKALATIYADHPDYREEWRR